MQKNKNNLFDTKIFAISNPREQDEFKTKVPYTIQKEYIPKDAHEFYKDFGYIVHPRTGKQVPKLTGYQYDIWNCPAKTVLVDKSQKTGITTSELLHDFQELLLNGRGKDLLIVGQTSNAAIEHLYTLKRLIVDSPKYRKYLITKSSELYFREEQTKVGTLYIKNPDNPYRPMRIIALGFVVSALWSWKNIFRIHMSDPAAANVVDDSGVYAALMSRLTNTDGRMMIEGPPRGPQGRFFELYEQFKDNKSNEFKVFLVTIYDALREGLVTKEFIEKAKLELGPLFPQTYAGSFTAGVGNVFDPDIIQKAITLGEELKNIPISQYTLKCIGCDPSFGSSKTGIVMCEHDRDSDKIIVRYSKQFTRPNPQDMANLLWEMHMKYQNCWFIVDGANRGFITELKIMFNEDPLWDPKSVSPETMHIVPVNFMKEHRDMLSKLYTFMHKGMIAIPKEYDELITSLRTAQSNEYSLDKQQTVNDDLLDAFRLSLKGYNIK